MALKYKMTEDGTAVVIGEKGHPVVYDPDKEGPESEFGLDAIHLFGKIPSLQEEAKRYRLQKEEYENKLKSYEGIEDPEAARAALEKLKNWNDKDYIDAKKVEQLKEQLLKVEQEKFNDLKKTYSTAVEERDQTINGLRNDINKYLISTNFSRSDLFAGDERKTYYTPEAAEAYFGRYFDVEKDGDKLAIVGYEEPEKRNKIFSRERPGSLAGFEEAIRWIVNNHKDKDAIMKPAVGTGATGSTSSRNKTGIDKKLLSTLSPKERISYLRNNQATG